MLEWRQLTSDDVDSVECEGHEDEEEPLRDSARRVHGDATCSHVEGSELMTVGRPIELQRDAVCAFT